jgi:hypothetical protein
MEAQYSKLNSRSSMLYEKSAMLDGAEEKTTALASRPENANDEEAAAIRDFHGGERDVGELP